MRLRRFSLRVCFLWLASLTRSLSKIVPTASAACRPDPVLFEESSTPLQEPSVTRQIALLMRLRELLMLRSTLYSDNDPVLISYVQSLMEVDLLIKRLSDKQACSVTVTSEDPSTEQDTKELGSQQSQEKMQFGAAVTLTDLSERVELRTDITDN